MEKPVMVVGIDDSDHSFYALEWTLEKFFSSAPENSAFKLVVLHSKPSATSAVGLTGSDMFAGAAGALPFVEKDFKKTASKVIEKAKQICAANSVKDVKFEAPEGDPRNVLCEIVDKLNVSVLVVGSHGYGAIKRAVLGSVSDYCAHHAHCSVMIVKKPRKTRH